MALVMLVAETEDSIPALLQRMASMTQMMQGPEAGQEYLELEQSVKSDLAEALVDHSNQAIGRLHSTLHQLVQVNQMIPLPPTLVAAIKEFESLKCRDSEHVLAVLNRANTAIDAYGAALMTRGGLAPSDPAILRLLTTKRQLASLLQDQDFSILWNWAPKEQMAAMGQNPWQPSPVQTSAFPSLPIEGLSHNDGERCRQLVETYTETLTGGGVIRLGGLLMSQLINNSAEANADLIHSVISLGLMVL